MRGRRNSGSLLRIVALDVDIPLIGFDGHERLGIRFPAVQLEIDVRPVSLDPVLDRALSAFQHDARLIEVDVRQELVHEVFRHLSKRFFTVRLTFRGLFVAPEVLRLLLLLRKSLHVFEVLVLDLFKFGLLFFKHGNVHLTVHLGEADYLCIGHLNEFGSQQIQVNALGLALVLVFEKSESINVLSQLRFLSFVNSVALYPTYEESDTTRVYKKSGHNWLVLLEEQLTLAV